MRPGHRRILLLGGTSEIGLAICAEYLAHAPATIVLACQPGDPVADAAAQQMRAAGARDVVVLDFDATAFDTHAAVLDAAWAGADVDVAIVAFGLLGDAEELWQDQAKAVQIAQVNYTGAVSVGVLLGQRLGAQGHGHPAAAVSFLLQGSGHDGHNACRYGNLSGSQSRGLQEGHICRSRGFADL